MAFLQKSAQLIFFGDKFLCDGGDFHEYWTVGATGEPFEPGIGSLPDSRNALQGHSVFGVGLKVLAW